MTEKAKKETKKVKVEKLPENWKNLSLEKKYRLVNEKLHKLAQHQLSGEQRTKTLKLQEVEL